MVAVNEEALAIAKMNVMEAFEVFKTIMEKDDEVLYKKIRFGEKPGLEFDLYSYYRGMNVIIKKKKGIMMINGRSFRIEDVDTELDARTKIIKDFLLANSKRIDLTKSRSGTPRGIGEN